MQKHKIIFSQKPFTVLSQVWHAQRDEYR